MKFWNSPLLVLAAAVLALLGFVVYETSDRGDPNCYESPASVDVGRVMTLLPGPDRIYVCGLRSRSALPDVIQCYELNKGCSK